MQAKFLSAAMSQERWQKITGVPLTIAAVVFLIAYAWEVIGNLAGVSGAVAEAAR